MKRRSFLSMLGGAAVAPALPSMGAAAPVVSGYNRYMYGLAVFHARTQGSVTAAGLMAKMGISAAQAGAMMTEMAVRGVLTSATGAMAPQAVTATRRPYVRRALRLLADAVQDGGETASDTPVAEQCQETAT